MEHPHERKRDNSLPLRRYTIANPVLSAVEKTAVVCPRQLCGNDVCRLRCTYSTGTCSRTYRYVCVSSDVSQWISRARICWWYSVGTRVLRTDDGNGNAFRPLRGRPVYGYGLTVRRAWPIGCNHLPRDLKMPTAYIGIFLSYLYNSLYITWPQSPAHILTFSRNQKSFL